MRIHDLEAAEWRETAGGYHKKSIASDVALLDIGKDVELEMNGAGQHLIVVLNGAGKIAAGSRGALLGGGICLGLTSSERVSMRPDAETGLLLLHMRLTEEAAESLFASIPERSDGWEIESQSPATAAPEASVELALAPDQEDSAGSWEEDDDYDDKRREVAAASAPAVTEAAEVAESNRAGKGAGDDVADVDDVYADDDEDEDEDPEADGAVAANDAEELAESELGSEVEAPAAGEGALAAAAAHATEDTPWYGSNRSNGAFGLLPRGLIHRTESGELVLNGRAIHAGQNLSIYHRRRWVQARVRGENGRWHVVVASQHVPLVPGMRARQDI